MKRNKRKNVHLIPSAAEKEIEASFWPNCSLIDYNETFYQKKDITSLKEVNFNNEDDLISWLNIYGLEYHEAIKQIVYRNKLDEFVVNLTAEHNHRNKAIELSNCFFFTLKAPVYSESQEEIKFEQLIFIVGKDFVWSIQEVKGDYFGHIRTRLAENLGLVRKKSADYLFYLLIEAVLDTYYATYEVLLQQSESLKDFSNVQAVPAFAAYVEENKANLFQLKKIANSLKEALVRLERVEFDFFNTKYLVELKEQINLMNDEIDFNLQQLESSINLIINIQNNRLNEVMRTLTVLSVVFIPLTFLAGIYGMNFDNMPETKMTNGYFVLLGVMLLIAVVTLLYFKKKKWFD